MLIKICPRCRRIIRHGGSYCPQCQEKRDAEMAEYEKKSKAKYNKHYNADRDPKYKRFYNSKAWKTLRERLMTKAGWECEVDGCHRTATELHHDPPLSTPEGWAGRLCPDNLHPLCAQHHNEAHDRFKSRKS